MSAAGTSPAGGTTGDREMAAVAIPKAVLDRLDHELHELCQPLTAMQCRLELGGMIGDEQALRDAVEGSLMDAARMFQRVAQMRARLFGTTGQTKVMNGG